MQGIVTGTQPGDSVKVWFTGARRRRASRSRTRRRSSRRTACSSSRRRTTPDVAGVQEEPAARVPVVLPRRAGGGRLPADVYDVDANGREAPSVLGVLSHYKAVIWYTGDDVITREPGHGAGHRVAARQRRDARRSRVPQRGRPPALHGQVRGPRDRAGLRVQPRDERAVRSRQRPPTAARRCRTTSCSTTSARTSTTRTPGRRRRASSTT